MLVKGATGVNVLIHLCPEQDGDNVATDNLSNICLNEICRCFPLASALGDMTENFSYDFRHKNQSVSNNFMTLVWLAANKPCDFIDGEY